MGTKYCSIQSLKITSDLSGRGLLPCLQSTLSKRRPPELYFWYYTSCSSNRYDLIRIDLYISPQLQTFLILIQSCLLIGFNQSPILYSNLLTVHHSILYTTRVSNIANVNNVVCRVNGFSLILLSKDNHVYIQVSRTLAILRSSFLDIKTCLE